MTAMAPALRGAVPLREVRGAYIHGDYILVLDMNSDLWVFRVK